MSLNGQSAVVGFKDGSVRVISLISEKLSDPKKDFDQPVTVVRISPRQTTVAVAWANGQLKVYKLPSMEIRSSMKGHVGAITHLDWSAASDVIHTNAKDHKMLFWDLATGDELPNGGKDLRDEQWSTWTCIHGWPVQGIIYEQMVPISACMRSRHDHHNYRLLATANLAGVLKLFRYAIYLHI